MEHEIISSSIQIFVRVCDRHTQSYCVLHICGTNRNTLYVCVYACVCMFKQLHALVWRV